MCVVFFCVSMFVFVLLIIDIDRVVRVVLCCVVLCCVVLFRVAL